MGRGFVAAMQENQLWEISAVYDINPAVRQLARRRVPGAAIYEAPDRIFEDPGIDVVGLFTLADARPQQIRQALATGKHVLAEKPLGADVGTEWQLVREIEAGMDVDGNGTPDLDPSRIYFAGASQGGEYGTMFMAVEPDVRAGTLTVPGDLWVDLRLGTIVRNTTRDALAERVPSLINAPGVTTIDGLPVNGNGPYFNENLPLRDGIPFTVHLEDGTDQVIQSPVSNAVPGAIAIQEVLDHQVWGMMSGDTLAYAPHVRKAPLPGVPAKSVIYQFDAGDEIAPNPATTALLRAGDLADQATYYRNDLAHAKDPQVPTVGHQFLWSYLTNPDPLVAAIARGAQEQIATFLASDGTTIIHPEPARFFETPIQGPLPEDLNYIP